MATDLPDRYSPGAQRDNLVIEPVQTRLPLDHDLRLEAAVAGHAAPRSRPTRLSVSTVVGVPAVAVVAGPSAGGIALLIAEMVRQFGTQRSLEKRLLQLLEKAVLAQQLLRLLVAGQKLVKMFSALLGIVWSPFQGRPRFSRTPDSCRSRNIPLGEAEKHHYATLDQPAMAA